MSEPIRTEQALYAGIYQNCDGLNYTLAGYEEKLIADGMSLTAFAGYGTNFKNNNIDLVTDIKGTVNYDKNGLLNQNIRLRGKFQKDKESFQIRYSPLSLNVPVNDKTSLYVNPHYVGQVGYDGKWKNSAGIFAGATQKIGNNTKISLEVQRYNLQNINDNSSANWGINAVISYNFN